jgi:hypothetical protein
MLVIRHDLVVATVSVFVERNAKERAKLGESRSPRGIDLEVDGDQITRRDAKKQLTPVVRPDGFESAAW